MAEETQGRVSECRFALIGGSAFPGRWRNQRVVSVSPTVRNVRSSCFHSTHMKQPQVLRLCFLWNRYLLYEQGCKAPAFFFVFTSPKWFTGCMKAVKFPSFGYHSQLSSRPSPQGCGRSKRAGCFPASPIFPGVLPGLFYGICFSFARSPT